MTPRWRPGRPLLGGLGLLALLCIGFAWGERAGWPWLAQPLARVLSDRLGRGVTDYDRDGRVTPFGKPDDALAGTAQYLVKRGKYRL